MNFFGAVRQKMLDEKVMSLLIHKVFGSQKFLELPIGRPTTFQYCETNNFRKKLCDNPLRCIKFFGNRNFLKQ